MKIVSWNVNSVRARSEHVQHMLEHVQPSVLCMQETKVVDAEFPDMFGSRTVTVNGQPAYNGVASVTKLGHDAYETDPFGDELGRRVVAISYRGLRIINVYIPNGGKDLEAYTAKLAWLNALHKYLKIQRQLFTHVIVTGDFNICPTDDDCYDPKRWKDQVTCTKPERLAFHRMLKLGFVDAASHLDDTNFTWFDYRFKSFDRGAGLRIDHFLITKSLLPYLKKCKVLGKYRAMDRPSDHAPLMLEIKK